MTIYYTPKEVASMLKLSLNTVTALCASLPGVIVIAKEKPGRRAYRTLRIPAAAIEQMGRKA